MKYTIESIPAITVWGLVCGLIGGLAYSGIYFFGSFITTYRAEYLIRYFFKDI